MRNHQHRGTQTPPPSHETMALEWNVVRVLKEGLEMAIHKYAQQDTILSFRRRNNNVCRRVGQIYKRHMAKIFCSCRKPCFGRHHGIPSRVGQANLCGGDVWSRGRELRGTGLLTFTYKFESSAIDGKISESSGLAAGGGVALRCRRCCSRSDGGEALVRSKTA